MKLMIVCIMIVVLCCPAAHAYLPPPTSPYTMTFDDIPPGNDLSYYDEQYGLWLIPGWEVVELSGTNVLTWCGNPAFGAGFGFGSDPVDYPETTFLPYTVQAVGAYFSTEPGVVLKMIGYTRGSTPSVVASVEIGSTEGSWSGYAEIHSEIANIDYVVVSGVNSQDDRYHFYLDDLTINPVPEPASLAAVALGLGGLLLRRRKS